MTTIKLAEGETELQSVITGIPQGLPISSILFLFFAADILKTVNNDAL